MFVVPHVVAIVLVLAFLTIPVGLIRLARKISDKLSAR
jgi:hypothetical protein